jgi:hypothetical protein
MPTERLTTVALDPLQVIDVGLGRQRFVRIASRGGTPGPGCGELVGRLGGIAVGAPCFGGGVPGWTPRCAPSKHAKAYARSASSSVDAPPARLIDAQA